MSTHRSCIDITLMAFYIYLHLRINLYFLTLGYCYTYFVIIILCTGIKYWLNLNEHV